jgi:hypothetical protein
MIHGNFGVNIDSLPIANSSHMPFRATTMGPALGTDIALFC